MSIISPSHIATKFGIQLTGVIHIGAHEGQEIAEYLDLGLKRICLFEANDEHAPVLDRYAARHAEITVQYVAISDHNGLSAFNVMSNSEASSLLDLKMHADVYPEITNLSKKLVETKTLDSLYPDHDVSGINLLNIDIQGAELSALKGAERILDRMDVVIAEVNFAEMYEGCPLIEEIDLFLFEKGFIRVETSTPYHPTWGDAAYVRSSSIHDISLVNLDRRHLVTMSTLGSNGRFANQLFQYLFVILYGLRSGCQPVLPVFDARCFLKQSLAAEGEATLSQLPWLESLEASFLETKNPARNVDIFGYFQGIPAAYRTHKCFIRKLLQANSGLETAGRDWLHQVQSSFKRIVGLHIRRGDYIEFDKNNVDRFARVPNEMYRNWLSEHLEKGDGVFISTDDQSELANFGDFPLLNTLFPRPSSIAGLEGDFYLLSQCDLAAYCNSSFSMMAALLAKPGQQPYMIDFSEARFIPFEPWDEDWFWRRFVSLDGDDWHDRNIEMFISHAKAKDELSDTKSELEQISIKMDSKNKLLHEAAVNLQESNCRLENTMSELGETKMILSSPVAHLLDYSCSRLLGSDSAISLASLVSFGRPNALQRLCLRARKNFQRYENFAKPHDARAQ